MKSRRNLTDLRALHLFSPNYSRLNILTLAFLFIDYCFELMWAHVSITILCHIQSISSHCLTTGCSLQCMWDLTQLFSAMKKSYSSQWEHSMNKDCRRTVFSLPSIFHREQNPQNARKPKPKPSNQILPALNLNTKLKESFLL